MRDYLWKHGKCEVGEVKKTLKVFPNLVWDPLSNI